jgi:hypothetical protein
MIYSNRSFKRERERRMIYPILQSYVMEKKRKKEKEKTWNVLSRNFFGIEQGGKKTHTMNMIVRERVAWGGGGNKK